MREKHRSILILTLVLLNLSLVSFNMHEKNTTTVYLNHEEEKIISVSEIHKNKVKIYYPKTDYNRLNTAIQKQMNQYKKEFENSIVDTTVQKNAYYTLTIVYDEYSFRNLLSYVFYIEEDTGGAHPNHYMWSISYDKENNQIIDIVSLQKQYPNLLKNFSTYSREELIVNPKVDMNMMLEGTKPTPNNFSVFAFSPKGIILFFPQYQVAPYSEGTFEITYPYPIR